MLKRSKSKETSGGGAIIGMGSQTQRINPSAVMNNDGSAVDAAGNPINTQQNNIRLAGAAGGIQNGQRNANLLP